MKSINCHREAKIPVGGSIRTISLFSLRIQQRPISQNVAFRTLESEKPNQNETSKTKGKVEIFMRKREREKFKL